MSNKQNLSIPLSIIAAGAMIALAVYFGGSGGSANRPNVAVEKNVEVAPIEANDRILGNPNAEVVVIEYSDTECPFCKVFHSTMHSVVDAYQGKVAWVYRHYPIAQLHAKAIKEAEATECAAEQGGNAVFWKYIDQVFARTNSNDSLDPAELPRIASDLGLNVTAFNSCLSSGKYSEKIRDDIEAAQLAGASGTPSSILMLKEELSKRDKEDIQNLVASQNIPLDAVGFIEGDKSLFLGGAMPYNLMTGILDILLK